MRLCMQLTLYFFTLGTGKSQEKLGQKNRDSWDHGRYASFFSSHARLSSFSLRITSPTKGNLITIFFFFFFEKAVFCYNYIKKPHTFVSGSKAFVLTSVESRCVLCSSLVSCHPVSTQACVLANLQFYSLFALRSLNRNWTRMRMLPPPNIYQRSHKKSFVCCDLPCMLIVRCIFWQKKSWKSRGTASMMWMSYISNSLILLMNTYRLYIVASFWVWSLSNGKEFRKASKVHVYDW